MQLILFFAKAGHVEVVAETRFVRRPWRLHLERVAALWGPRREEVITLSSIETIEPVNRGHQVEPDRDMTVDRVHITHPR